MPENGDRLVSGLQAWTRDHDLHARAAVDLLIWHDFWLRRPDFVKTCTEQWDGLVTIDWQRAREFADSNPRASTSQVAILDLAIALGENRYRLSIMGDAHSRAIVDAVAQAVGGAACLNRST